MRFPNPPRLWLQLFPGKSIPFLHRGAQTPLTTSCLLGKLPWPFCVLSHHSLSDATSLMRTHEVFLSERNQHMGNVQLLRGKVTHTYGQISRWDYFERENLYTESFNQLNVLSEKSVLGHSSPTLKRRQLRT